MKYTGKIEEILKGEKLSEKTNYNYRVYRLKKS